MTSAGN